jgi:hypothetical protein
MSCLFCYFQELLFLVGWLSRGIGWYRFHDAILFEHDDPPYTLHLDTVLGLETSPLT